MEEMDQTFKIQLGELDNLYAMPANIATLIRNMNDVILTPIFSLLMSLAVLYFVWGLYQFLSSKAGGQLDIETGKNHMIWGLIGLLIMISAVAIINIVLGTFDIPTI